MDIMNNEKNAYVLTEEDKINIKACLKPTKTVWNAIKDITKRKYDSYLEQLEPTCNTVDRKSDFSSIRNRWNAVKDDKSKKDEYLKTDQFDDDLIYVLKAFAQRVRGIRTSGSWKMNIQQNIKNWRENPTMKRDTLLKIAVGFGLTINETQELIFSVLSDDEQLALDPRLANEMIYQYAIIHGIPLTQKHKEALSVKIMIEEGGHIYLQKMFGNKYEDCYDELISICSDKINIFDSFNMTKIAYILAAISLKNKGRLKIDKIEDLVFPRKKQPKDKDNQKDIDAEDFEAADNSEASTALRKHPLIPSQSVAELCYLYSVGEFRERKEPSFDDVQKTKEQFIKILFKVQSWISSAIKGAELRLSSKDEVIKEELKDMMLRYIGSLRNYIDSQSDDTMFSPYDLIPIMKGSGLEKSSQTDFGEMITNTILGKLKTDHNKHNVNDDDFEYCKLLLSSMRVAFRDLRASAQRNRFDLYEIYSEMNEILYYPYFDSKGIGMDIHDYEKDNCISELPYTFTMEQSEYALEDAVDIEDYKDYLNVRLNNIHCSEQFDHVRLSRGKEELVKYLAGKVYIISDSDSNTDDMIPLFFSKPKNEYNEYEEMYFRKKDEHKEFLDSFYDIKKFRDQYVNKSLPYKRKDILKLVFWSFVYDPNYKRGTIPINRRLKFKEYFNGSDENDDWKKMIERTQCAKINENNSLDRLLLCCVEHQDPIGFLEAAYKECGSKLKKIF